MSIRITEENNMALNWIKSININHFKGIENLKLNDLKRINLIIGDNNSGKTTLLEAIHLLKAPNSLSNILKTTRLRDEKQLNIYESFKTFLSKENKIDIHVKGNYLDYSLNLVGEEEKIILTEKDTFEFSKVLKNNETKSKKEVETIAFLGNLKSNINGKYNNKKIKVTPFSRILSNKNDDEIEMKYLSPINHMVEDVFLNIVSNDKYKKVCINLIRQFDSNIEDLLYMKNSIDGTAMEYVLDKKLGFRPLYSYGDGIRKVLSIANAMMESINGILLIDEIDTSIHYSHYENIFNFIFMAAEELQIQLFITTHSDEAIEWILKTQNYGDNYDISKEKLNVITLRKNIDGTILARSMAGHEVLEVKEKIDFEVRS